MPKLACRCGYVHNLSPIPDDGLQVLPDRLLHPSERTRASCTPRAADRVRGPEIRRIGTAGRC
ncbi:hypothetical protein NUM_62870 [Actinocatenispora comari]|uniref:Uncharacterized protein n=1 Tax=Actinocatenispora comari TaxID=2807577 RepID=A0A8J4AH50_9ACTN|nr:hypothetical protein NUM_62870 [Actinocatenispora comari]